MLQCLLRAGNLRSSPAQKATPVQRESRATHLQALREEGPQLRLQQLPVGGRGDESEGGWESDSIEGQRGSQGTVGARGHVLSPT